MEEEEKQGESFVFFESFLESSRHMPPETKNRYFDMIIEYGINNKMPEVDDTPTDNWAYSVFLSSYPAIDGAKRRRKASQENGKKGGRPPNKPPDDMPFPDLTELARKAGNP